MGLPPFDPATGYLPSGEHRATWPEVLDRFGWNPVRRALLDGMQEALVLLAAAGCTKVWLDGSFVTAKDEPGDFDAVWADDGGDEERLDPIFYEFAHGRRAQKLRFGGELFPNWIDASSHSRFVDFFQHDSERRSKGIVVIDPSEVLP